VDKTTLLKTLHDKINTITSLSEIQIISSCIKVLETGTVKSVATYTDLSSINPQKGELYFVEDEERLYFGFGTFWYLATDSAIASVWTWGNNSSTQLGNGTSGAGTSRSSPVSVVGGFTDWVQISAGDYHTAAVRANGTAWAWGFNGSGQLGDESTTSRLSPVSVVGGFTDWVQISAGSSHTAAVRANGSAWCWGAGNYGRLGNSSTINRSSPVSVVGGYTDWVQISAGRDHTAAVRANGTAWCWGPGGSGRLGNNTQFNSSSPVSVVGDYTDWVQISAGRFHTAAVRANGTAWCWGNTFRGILGDASTINRSSPVSVVGGYTDWVQISAGRYHTAAVRANGSAWCWGSGGTGRLGNSDGTSDRSSPVSVVGGFTDWVQISAGRASYGHTAALRANGTAWCWGYNFRGMLGDNSVTQRSSPVSVVGGFTDWVGISAGGAHTAAVRIEP